MRVSNVERALIRAWQMGHISIHELRAKLGDERYTKIDPLKRVR